MGSEEPTCSVPDGFDVTPTGLILFEGDVIVSTVAELEDDCAAGRRWRGFDRRFLVDKQAYGTGVASGNAKWTWNAMANRYVVPYEIDPALSNGANRVEEAAKYWGCIDTDPGPCGVNTKLYFRQRNPASDPDYVYFTNGAGNCSSSELGRAGGRQEIYIPTPIATSQIMGMAISTTGKTYTWFNNGKATEGTTTEADSVRAQFAYASAGGTVPTMIVAMAISKANGHVFAWYTNYTVSEGTPEDLDYYNSGTYSPGSKSSAMIAEIDIGTAGNVYAWYTDGSYSIGTTTQLDSIQGPTSYVTAPNHTWTDILGIAIGTGATVYAWYTDGSFSAGTVANLGTIQGEFEMPADCAASSLAHEIGHALGLAHEQTRCDRDDHVRIYWDNIEDHKDHNFWIHGRSDNTCDPSSRVDIGDYDFESRMHYGSYGFSRNDSPTMLRKVPDGLPIPAADVVDMGISMSANVYTWWSVEDVPGHRTLTATSGTKDKLESVRSRYSVALPSGMLYSDVVGVAIAKNSSNAYAYFKSPKKFSVGQTHDFSTAPIPYTMPSGVGDLIAVDIGPDNRFYAWYHGGWVSSGTATNLSAYMAPVPFTLPSPQTVDTILGIAIGTGGTVYAWYDDGTYSSGAVNDLAITQGPAPFAGRLKIITTSSSLSPGDGAAMNYLYP